MSIRSFALLTAIAVLFTSCESPTGPTPVASIEITAPTTTLAIGTTVQLTAVIRSRNGIILAGRAIAWSSSDSSSATVSSTGLVTALQAVSVTIIASREGKSGSIEITGLPAPRVNLTLNQSKVFVGDTVTLTWSSESATSCTATGSWNVGSGTAGRYHFIADTGGVKSFTLTCTGNGGTTAATQELVVRMPVYATSYRNFKDIGLAPREAPTGATARAYADFSGRGVRDLVTFTIKYGLADSLNLPPSQIQFWRPQASGFVIDQSVRVRETVLPCLHPRKAIIADFNRDRLPDVFVACHGYDYGTFPGEKNQILLSLADASYELRNASPDVAFWHGATAADINDDGAPDILAVTDNGQTVPFLNDGAGRFTRAEGYPFSTRGPAGYFNIDLVDIDEDGHLDLFVAGHEWNDNTETTIWMGDGSYRFDGARIVIPPVPGAGGVVNDLVVTGSSSTRTLWLSRTSGGAESFYSGAVLQRYDLSARAASIALQRPTAPWVEWLIAYPKGSQSCVGSERAQSNLETCW